MSVHNRNFGGTEQRRTLDITTNAALTNGETGILGYVPYISTLEGANCAAGYLAGTPNMIFNITRFVVGVGVTVMPLGTTFTPQVYGTSGAYLSGIPSLSLAGSATILLAENDVITYQMAGGTTTGIFGFAACFVIKPVQDLKRFFGFI